MLASELCRSSASGLASVCSSEYFRGLEGRESAPVATIVLKLRTMVRITFASQSTDVTCKAVVQRQIISGGLRRAQTSAAAAAAFGALTTSSKLHKHHKALHHNQNPNAWQTLEP